MSKIQTILHIKVWKSFSHLLHSLCKFSLYAKTYFHSNSFFLCACHSNDLIFFIINSLTISVSFFSFMNVYVSFGSKMNCCSIFWYSSSSSTKKSQLRIKSFDLCSVLNFIGEHLEKRFADFWYSFVGISGNWMLIFRRIISFYGVSGVPGRFS
jgi:hypothetical protein